MLHWKHAITKAMLASGFFAGCGPDPTVHYAKQLEYDVGGYYVDHPSDSTYMAHSKREVFIISNPPSDRNALVQLVVDNEKRLPVDRNQISWTCDEFYRFYYKESWETSLDLVEYSSPLSVEDLSTHTKDLICKVTMQKYYRGTVADSVRCRWTCNCTKTGDTLVEYRSAKP
jgi:hypothetical protein